MHLAAVLVLAVVLVLVIVLVLILVLVIVLVLILILITVLIIHGLISSFLCLRRTAMIDCPFFHALSLGRKIKLTVSPAVMAAVIPPAAAFSPPVKIPRNPSVSTASLTPFASV